LGDGNRRIVETCTRPQAPTELADTDMFLRNVLSSYQTTRSHNREPQSEVKHYLLPTRNFLGSWGSSDRIVTTLGHDRRIVDRFAKESKVYSLIHIAETDAGGHPASYAMGTRGSFLRLKRPACEDAHSSAAHLHTNIRRHQHTSPPTHKYTSPRTYQLTNTNIPTHKHTNTTAYQHTNTPAHQHTYMPALQHKSTPTHKNTNTSTHHPTNTQTNQHTNSPTQRHTSYPLHSPPWHAQRQFYLLTYSLHGAESFLRS